MIYESECSHFGAGTMMKVRIPDSLIKDIQNEECILFLGAGASTEGTAYFKPKLVDRLATKCNFPSNSSKTLPRVAQYFCEVMDGGFKGRLLREIREYLDLYMEYGEANNVATMIHDIVAKIGFFKVIVTTNWDVFMERELNVLPIVRDTDLVYWKDRIRQVIKLHGCISQPDTMVVTEEDYKEFIDKRLDSPICNKIRDLMATKTFLFLGYSLEDESFQILQERVLSKMGKFSRSSYAVLREPTKDYTRSWKEKGVTIIPSYALAFMRDLYRIFIEDDVYFDIDFLTTLSDLRRRLHETHFTTEQEDTLGFVSAMYQDGLQHSLQHLHYGIMQGKPKSHFEEQLKLEAGRLNREVKKRDPTEISYWKGRVELLKWAFNTRRELKLYLNTDFKPINKEQFLDLKKIDSKHSN